MNGTQASLFSGETLRNAGMSLASDNAEVKEPGWSEAAYDLLKDFIKGRTKDFLCEDFRSYCERMNLTTPPSLRAYGGIIMKASKQGLIRKVGFANVKNPKAHATPASRWITTNNL